MHMKCIFQMYHVGMRSVVVVVTHENVTNLCYTYLMSFIGDTLHVYIIIIKVNWLYASLILYVWFGFILYACVVN